MGREAGGASHDRISPTEFDSRSPFGDLGDQATPLQALLEANVPKADPCVHGILTALGGFSINELLPHLDWDLIAQNPKVFCGYSDITALQNAILGSTGLVRPMVS
jgi:muramoyltetrapeptide carboxypeptidase